MRQLPRELRVWSRVKSARSSPRRQARALGRLFEADGALDDVERPALHFRVNATDVESDDAGHQHVRAAETGDDDDGRAPAARKARVAERPAPDHNEPVDERERGNRGAAPERQAKR